MKRNDGFTLIELMIVVVILGILAAIATSNWLSMQGSAKEASTKANCRTLALAAEDFAVRNEGIYPANTADPLPAWGGMTLIDLLPKGQDLPNAWGTPVCVIDGVPAIQGQVGYLPIAPLGINEGYRIQGFGRNSIVLTLSSGQ